MTKKSGPRLAGLTVAYKLIELAHTRWQAVTAPHRIPLIKARVVFDKGVVAEPSEAEEDEIAA